MPQTEVERQIYQLPTGNSDTLANPLNRRTLTEPPHWQNFSSLQTIAENLGLEPQPEINTRKGSWKIYSKDDLIVPNFQDRGTKVNIGLGLYEVPGEGKSVVRNAVLKFSQDELPPGSFETDLDALTTRYLERPRFWGLPNQELSFSKCLFGGAVIGAVPGFFYDNLIIGLPYGACLGLMIGVSGYEFIERYAIWHIADPRSLRVDNQAYETLALMREHISQVRTQEALLAALEAEQLNYSPDFFLRGIWPQMPQVLKSRGAVAMINAQNTGYQIDAINQLVQVVKILGIPSQP